MSRTVHTKHQASLSIEELFLQPRQQNQQWLLTYLDVFVLIIMLVISLIAISDFGAEEKTKNLQNDLKELTSPLTYETNKPNTEISLDPKKEKEPVARQDKLITDNLNQEEQGIQQQEDLQAKTALEPSDIVKEKTTVVEHQNKDEYKEVKPKQENQLSDDTLQKQLKKSVDQLGLTDSVDMSVTLGYAQLEIQDKILFKSSDAALLKVGETLLKKLIPLLAQSSGLIYIEGHTDNRPIKTNKYPSNWELGAARATSVLHFLAAQKLESPRLRAITYGDTKPIADNLTKEGREKNRRVSLVIKISDKID